MGQPCNIPNLLLVREFILIQHTVYTIYLKICSLYIEKLNISIYIIIILFARKTFVFIVKSRVQINS